MAAIISRCPSSSVPKSQTQRNTLPKTRQNQGLSDLYLREIPNVPIPGYLYSMQITEEDSRRRDKPTWQVDVCAALPDDRTLIGGAAR